MRFKNFSQGKNGFIFLNFLFIAVGVAIISIYLFKNEDIIFSLAQVALSPFK